MFGKRRRERDFVKKTNEALRFNDELIKKGENATDEDFEALKRRYREAGEALKKTGRG